MLYLILILIVFIFILLFNSIYFITLDTRAVWRSIPKFQFGFKERSSLMPLCLLRD